MSKRPVREKATRPSADSLTLRPAGVEDWPTISALFGAKGACGGCWCMYWRVERGGRLWDETRGEPARRRLHTLLTTGAVHAILAFDRDMPVGWACVGPYNDFPRLQRVRALERDRPHGIWSVVCFYVSPRYRHQGIATNLLVKACDLAFVHGATAVEGYPINVHGDRQMPGAFAWTGVPAIFSRAGFTRLDNPFHSRSVWVIGATIGN